MLVLIFLSFNACSMIQLYNLYLYQLFNINVLQFIVYVRVLIYLHCFYVILNSLILCFLDVHSLEVFFNW